MPASVHVIDRRSILAVEASMAAGRPLLVRGEPGTGKSQLARAVAEKLGRALVVYAVDARTETRDLLWTVDSVRRLAEAQVMAALDDVAHDEAMRRIELSRFVLPGPLWWAFRWAGAHEQAQKAGVNVARDDDAQGRAKGAVLLIDEIDKADSSVPNGLLDALGHGRFDVIGAPSVTVDPDRRPVVVITTNEERSLPDAFLRRCLVLQLEVPRDAAAMKAFLLSRARAHFEKCAEKVIERAAEMLIEDRRRCLDADLCPPGVAEFIDLVRVVTDQYPASAKRQLELMEEVREFAFDKHPREPGS
jgi:MoxR-like ATPase